MDDPVKSSSLKEFWGKRWDTVLQSLLKEYVYKPLRKKYDVSRTMAGFITFFCSGLGHTLPISNGLGDLNMMFAMLLYFLTFMPKLTNTVEVFQLSIFCISVLYLIGFGGIGVIVDDDDGGKQARRSKGKKGKKRS
eukprot:g4323.t1